MEVGIPSNLARLEAALTSPRPPAAIAELADRLADPLLLDLLFRIEARRLIRIGPSSEAGRAPAPADLLELAAKAAEVGQLPASTAVEIRGFLYGLGRSLRAARTWREDLPLWWEPLPAAGELERLFGAVDEPVGDSFAPFSPEALEAAFGASSSGRRWLSIPSLLPADLCRSLNAALESAFQDGTLDLELGGVGAGTVSSSRGDSVRYFTGLETELLARLPYPAILIQWCLGRLIPDLVSRLEKRDPDRELHPPVKVMLARYPGPSGGYRPHLDNPGGSSDNGRAISMVLYLNDPGKPCAGGELALWKTGAAASAPPTEVFAPEGGSLAVFDSRLTLHQVRPLRTGPPRWSLALWLNEEPGGRFEAPPLPDLSLTDVLLPVGSPPVAEGRILFHELENSDPAGTIVVRRASPVRSRAGIVVTVYGAGEDLERWCRHHFDLGFEHLVLVFDRLEAPEEAALARRLGERFRRSRLTVWSSAALAEERWERRAGETGLRGLLSHARGGSSPQSVASRQTLNATAALHAAGTDELGGAPLDWLLHLDADELFYLHGEGRGGGDLGEHFATLSDAGIAHATYLNHELLLPSRAGSGPRFKCSPRLALARLGSAGWPRLAADLRMRQGDPRPYFNGYLNGKAAVAVDAGVAAAGVHGWRLLESSAAAERAFLAGPSVLHYRYASADAFCGKYLAMADSESGDPQLFESGRSDAAAVELVRSLRRAGEDEKTIRDRLLRLRDSLSGFTEIEAELLDEAGLLLEPALKFGLSVDGAPQPPPTIWRRWPCGANGPIWKSP